jgi:hypothetical protein
LIALRALDCVAPESVTGRSDRTKRSADYGERREKRGTFYAQWKDAAGTRRREATACTTRREAQRLAEELDRKAERQRRGLEPLPEPVPTMTFGELFDWWMKEYGSGCAGSSRAFSAGAL